MLQDGEVSCCEAAHPAVMSLPGLTKRTAAVRFAYKRLCSASTLHFLREDALLDDLPR